MTTFYLKLLLLLWIQWVLHLLQIIGNKCILVAVDILTRYAESVPIKDKTAVVIVKALGHHIIAHHSCPKTLVSDNALEFTSSDLSMICEFCIIK